MLNIVHAVQSLQTDALKILLLPVDEDADDEVVDLRAEHHPSDSVKPTSIDQKIEQLQEMKFDLRPFHAIGKRDRLDRLAEWVTSSLFVARIRSTNHLFVCCSFAERGGAYIRRSAEFAHAISGGDCLRKRWLVQRRY